jgi:hypothetical protein
MPLTNSLALRRALVSEFGETLDDLPGEWNQDMSICLVFMKLMENVQNAWYDGLNLTVWLD